jgi:hypothetical protein
MKNRNMPIEAIGAINEMRMALEEQFSMPVLDIQMMDAPDKSTISWLNEKAKKSDQVRLTKAFIVFGFVFVVCVTPCAPGSKHQWEAQVQTEEVGYVVLPDRPENVFYVGYGEDLDEFSEGLVTRCCQKLASVGEEKFKAWFNDCQEMNKKAKEQQDQ